MKSIECEIRSFITAEQYNELLKKFESEAKKVATEQQETFYFSGPQDLRIQRNDSYSKIWMKGGQIHDDQREEIEIRTERDNFENLEKLFLTLGYKVEIKWFRTRNSFIWNDISVALDYTKGYGYIIELEIMADEAGKDEEIAKLRANLKELGIEETLKAVFKEKYEHYKQHWQELTA